MANILITGAGGPAALAFMHGLSRERHAFVAVDVDPCAAGLFVPGVRARALVPRGDDPELIDALLAICRDHWIDILVPTVPSELLPIARARSRFERQGVAVLLSPPAALETSMDSHLAHEACKGVTPWARTEVLTPTTRWRGPCLVRPRRRGHGAARRCVDLPAGLPRDGSWLVQEWLDGTEYAVDVYINQQGEVLVAVPRQTMRVRSGVALAARTVRDPSLQEMAGTVATTLGLRGIVSVQIRRRADGTAVAFGVNPRVPGSMQLTVASGVRMPELAVREAMGDPVRRPPQFRELAMVRTLSATFIDPAEIERVQPPLAVV